MILSVRVSGTLHGWRHLWGKVVTGFDETQHCMKCLMGPRLREISPKMEPVVRFHGNPGDLVYLCGVADPWSWANNFHLAGRVAAGKSATVRMYTGTSITVSHLELLPIPPLPDGFRGLPKSFTTCRNFQFGHAYFAARQALTA